jgi:hypothetical protein
MKVRRFEIARVNRVVSNSGCVSRLPVELGAGLHPAPPDCAPNARQALS